jgi:pyrroline-5-carboxylate reductase
MAVRLVLMGGGRMGEALLEGLFAAKWAAPEEVLVVEPVAARRDELAARYAGLRVDTQPAAADGAIVAVKPNDVGAACDALHGALPQRVLSIAAGVTIDALERALPAQTPVVRAMANSPALVGQGAAALAAGTLATDDDVAWAEEILQAVGVTVRVPEKLLDAVTGLSGSGPAYVFLVAEALIEGGVAAGLPRDISETLAVQTLKGAATLLAESTESPEQLRAAVTSPGGTTAAGLRSLERAATRSAFIEAVLAATHRSRELGG